MPESPYRHPGSDRQTQAFSLVEIVLAIGLVSFSMLAIFALVAQGHKTSREARLESVAALLAGKATSALRASSAWVNPSGSEATNYIGNTSLATIAAGSPVTKNNYYDLNLSNVTTTKPEDRQFEIVTTVSPFQPNFLVPATTDTNVASSLANLPTAANTVFLTVEISHPALASEANRSKRSFVSIITRTSTK